MSTVTNFSLVFPRRQNILRDVKHQVRNLAENAKISQRRKTSKNHYHSLFTRTQSLIFKSFLENKALGDVFLSNGLIDIDLHRFQALLFLQRKVPTSGFKLIKLFGIDDFSAAKDFGKVFIIIIYYYYHHHHHHHHHHQCKCSWVSEDGSCLEK